MVIAWMALVVCVVLGGAVLLLILVRVVPPDGEKQTPPRYRSVGGPSGMPDHETVDPSSPCPRPAQRRYRPARLVTWSVSRGDDEAT